MAQVIRLLAENEILHLNLWNDPTSDPKRGIDSTGTVKKIMTDVSRLIIVPPDVIADIPSINDMDDVRETNLATEPRNCHFLDEAILGAGVGG